MIKTIEWNIPFKKKILDIKAWKYSKKPIFRYWLFVIEGPPKGGLNDFIMSFESQPDSIQYCINKVYKSSGQKIDLYDTQEQLIKRLNIS